MPETTPQALGIDAGGAHTRCCLVDSDGRLLGFALAGPANKNFIDPEDALENLTGALEALLDDVFGPCGDVFVPAAVLSGPHLPSDTSAMVRDRARPDTFMFIDEFEASLAAGLCGAGRWARGAPGVVIAAGTGSFCKGRNAAGDVRYTGGWGPLIGDEGSGYDIAREVLRAVAMSADGRGKSTELTRKALSHFGIDTPVGLKKSLYDPPIARHELAALARYAFEAAEAGDTVAAEILAEAGRRLAQLAAPVITELFGEDENFPVVLSGGVFQAESAVDRALTPMLQALRPGADAFRSALAPVMGAVATALDSLGVELGPRVVANLMDADLKMRDADAFGRATPDSGRKGE